MLQQKRNKRLTREFYLRDTIQVARDLLGKELVRILPDGQKLSGIVLETEAYLGLEDPACHSYSPSGPRRTARTEVMFHVGGVASYGSIVR
ncbi:MAG: DNA-3-methyladenine glycosylase [Bdellovibrionales bacterium]|nr:DNA-3-methyladenine glycosylase [Bdellovibrionales bacterium]